MDEHEVEGRRERITLSTPAIEVSKAEWLRIGYPEKPPTPSDAWHSGLLQRLLSGKEPQPQPPPRAHSYPWYELVDDGRYEGVCEVWVSEVGVVVLNQAPWRLISRSKSANNPHRDVYEIEWPATGLRATLSVSGDHRRCVVLLDD